MLIIQTGTVFQISLVFWRNKRKAFIVLKKNDAETKTLSADTKGRLLTVSF